MIRNIRNKFKRCLAKPQSDGNAAITYLDDFDSYYYPNGGIPSDKSYVMVHFPTYYYKCEDLGNYKYKLTIAEYKFSDDYKEEKECLVGAFEAHSDGTYLLSKPGVNSTGNQSITSFFNLAQANGSKWGLIDYRIHKIIANMFCLIYGITNIKDATWIAPCSGAAADADTSYVGWTSDLGNFDGKYTDSGDGTSSNFLGLENCYNGKWEFVQGVNVATGGSIIVYEGGLSVNKTAAQLQTEGYENVRTINAATSSGYITGITHGEYADVIPTDVGGSSDGYYADYYFYNNSNNYVMLRSGDAGNADKAGVFCFYSRLSTDAGAGLGTRLAFYGTIKEVTSEEFESITVDYNG